MKKLLAEDISPTRLCRIHYFFYRIKALQEDNTIYLLKESRYVRLANTMFRVLNKSRIPLFLHKKSNHTFTVWQHVVLLVLRQYEGKSYRMFVEWLIEAYYLRTSIHTIVTYSALYYSSEVCCYGKRYYIGKDNFLLYIVTQQYQKVIHWHHRFIRIQTSYPMLHNIILTK